MQDSDVGIDIAHQDRSAQSRSRNAMAPPNSANEILPIWDHLMLTVTTPYPLLLSLCHMYRCATLPGRRVPMSW